MTQPRLNFPNLYKAKDDLVNYLKKNKLDPFKDWSKDPIHGKMITKLVTALNKERDKVAEKYPYYDIKNQYKFKRTKIMKKLKKLQAKEEAKENKKKESSKAKESKVKKEKETKEEKKKTSQGRGPGITKYDYPLIDGREMTSEEKKKYRQEQRKLAAGKGEKSKKETEKEKPSKEGKDKKVKKTEKPAKEEKKDKKKKAKKEED